MSEETTSARPLLLRIWPVYLIAGGLIAAWQFGLFKLLSVDTLRAQQDTLTSFVAENWLLASATYVGIYSLATLFMMPGALWITIAGGLMFGLIGGSVLTVIGATLGASMLFFAAKTSFGDSLRKMAGSYADKIRDEFLKSPLSYMFTMRLVPAMPFPVANIVPALLNAKYRDYFITTAVGIIPGVVAYTWIGAGAGEVFAKGEDLDTASLARSLIPALAALATVSFIPIIYKKFFAKKPAELEGAN